MFTLHPDGTRFGTAVAALNGIVRGLRVPGAADPIADSTGNHREEEAEVHPVHRERGLGAAVIALVSVVAVSPASAAPTFKAPFPCGQRWTYSYHSAEVRRALDFVRDDGGPTFGDNVRGLQGR